MRRRRILKEGGAALSVITTAGLAGCSGDDGGDDSNGGGPESSDDTGETDSTDDGTASTDDDSTDETGSEEENSDEETTQVENCPREGVDGAQVSGEFDGSVVSNTIDGVAVESMGAGIVSDDQGGEILEIQITVTNTGDETTHARDYTYDLTVYDDSCTVLEIPGVTQYGISQDMEPGDSASLFITPTRSEFSLDQISAFEVSVSCSGSFAEGVYCPEGST